MSTTGSVGLRTKSSVLAAAVVVPVAVLLPSGAGADPGSPDEATAAPVVDDAPAAEEAPPPDWSGDPAPDDAVWAANVDPAPHLLPPGVAAEAGLQTRTILAARSISDAFPQITDMVGVRPDSHRWHPAGLALDVMIPNPGSSEGRELGDEIVAFALRNAERFGLQDAIWRGVYRTPGGPDASGYGHFDHVHLTTIGGGYPTGDEEYLSAEADPPTDERV